jgi:hypothetical protein
MHADLNVITKHSPNATNATKSTLNHIMLITVNSAPNQSEKNQKFNFSGVNAKWQNGLVERSNETLCAASRITLNAKPCNLKMGQNHNI